ncbi:MAG: PIN domain-containing protein [Gemmatimonadetes bacterium]|nr:PIN domain-containing protein [Gemmatimonadota bacterium]NNK47469.1 PIN domain-containing protein [Gemmatimonadota bacterium]
MTAYLFHADAIAEALRPQPRPAYVEWLRSLPREEQFTSAVSVAELYRGADESRDPAGNIRHIEERVLPAVTVLPFDVATARTFGELKAELAAATDLPTRELQVAATALYHGLELVTARTGRFRQVPHLKVRPLPRSRRTP